MAKTYYTYRIRVDNRDRVQVEKRNAQHQELDQPSGVFRYKEKLEEIDPLLQAAQKDELNDSSKTRALGEALFDVLFDDGLRHDFVNFYHHVVQQEKLLRVELAIDERGMPEIAALPWEFLCLPARANLGTIWMATVPKLAFSRRRAQWIPAQPIQLDKDEKLKIALVVSAPSDLPPVAYEPVQAALEKLASEQANRVELLPIVNSANPEAIDTILSKKPHIFHFIGHGHLVNEGNREVGQIAFVDPDFGEARWVDADYFSELFNQHCPGVVMLQACEGGRSSESQAFVGVASSIIQQNIPVVVAMQYEVTNSTASQFARRFYQQLAEDDPVDIAAQYSRRIIACGPTGYNKRDFATPVIFMRVQDGYLFSRQENEAKPLNQFKSLIEDKTKWFVGREYVFNAIQSFIANNPKGYFTIIGDPGQGKSAILAKYVQDTECIAHFNVQLQGLNRADQFLESICKQLVARYQLPYEPLPSMAKQDGEFLGRLLDEVAQKRNGQPVVIAVDALDEVDLGSCSDANILYLPPYLPDGVYFIMTRRRGVEVPCTIYAPVQIISLLDYQIDSQRDVRLYIQNRVDGSENLRQQINNRQETIIVFTDKIVDKSENNFRYLRYVLQDIEKGLYKDLSLESFPQGLQGYYDFHWRRMGMTANPLPDAKIKIVYILGEVTQPVSRQQICDFSGEETPTVQTVLNEWEQFLHELLKENQKRYSVYHSSFRDFLHHKDILEKTGLTIPGIHLLIAKDQLNKWKNRIAVSKFENPSPEDAEYVLNLPYHLKEAAKENAAIADDLFGLLTDYEFIAYKIFSLPPQALIEDYELALQPDIQISENQKDSLKLIQSAIDLAANVLADDPAQLAGQLWGRLQSFKKPEIQAMLAQTQQLPYIWLRPLTANLTQPKGALVRTLTGHRNWVKAVAITPDGRLAISASEDTTLKVWDLSSGVELRTLTGHSNDVHAVAITSDGQQVVSASEDKTIKVWDLSSGNILKTFTGHIGGVNAVAIVPDQKLLVSGSQDCTLKIWDLHSGSEFRILKGHSNSTAAIAITPNGRLAVSASRDKTLKVWDLHTGNELHTFTGHTDWVNAVAITPDGKLAVSASNDNTLKVWDINSGTELRTLIGHYYWVQTVAITPDGRFVVSGSWDQTLKVWDLKSGEEITTFNSEGKLNTCAISPDGVTIVAAGRSDRINFLRLEGIEELK